MRTPPYTRSVLAEVLPEVHGDPVPRDFATAPAWQETDLGCPLPDSDDACSVCLPTWDSVIGYEEGREKVLHRMRAGYPRFFKHPVVERLFAEAKREVAADGSQVLVLPTKLAAQRAHRWIERRTRSAVRTTSFHGLQAIVFPDKAIDDATAYWRFAGEVVSSRQARDTLDGTLRTDPPPAELAAALANLTGANPQDSFVFASGMAAVTAVLRSLPGLADGRKTLQIEFPYVDCLKIQELFGHGVAYLNRAEGEAFDEALRRIAQGEFAGVFTELPSNPLLRTADLARIAKACREGATPLVIDDSATGPANVEALRFADVLTSSLTKWISGGGDVLAGSASLRADSPFADTLREALKRDASEGAPLYATDAEQLLSNLHDYRQRNSAINLAGSAVASWLADREEIAEVWHPSLTTREYYDAARRTDGGYGGLLSFTLKNPKKTPRFYDALRLSKGPSFGTSFSLACPYVLLAHYRELEWAEDCGVSSHLIRLSCGLEPISSITDALEQALAEA